MSEERVTGNTVSRFPVAFSWGMASFLSMFAASYGMRYFYYDYY